MSKQGQNEENKNNRSSKLDPKTLEFSPYFKGEKHNLVLVCADIRQQQKN